MWNAISLVQIWTRVAVSISCDDNHYTTGTSSNPYMLLKYEIIWTTISQVIRLRNDINFTETECGKMTQKSVFNIKTPVGVMLFLSEDRL